ncbi:hypothetical protein LTR66_007355 [Elasticomyces elasticus]|nr:hypothetical protein LTR66_007355 [Elasticomyces elasticus]
MSNVKTRILIISDTHTAPLLALDRSDVRDSYVAFKQSLPSADVLIHCGDMTFTGAQHEYDTTLDMLGKIDAPLKLVIAGNHDRTLDESFVRSHARLYAPPLQNDIIRDARAMWLGEDGRAKREGVTYLDEGVHTFRLHNGARLRVYASPYTPAFCGWAFPYGANEDRFNPAGSAFSDAKSIVQNPVPSFVSDSTENIDVMITHGPPYECLDKTVRNSRAGCPHLLRAVTRSRPLIHCFGHIHEGYGVEHIKWSDKADELATTAMKKQDCTGGGWRPGVENITKVPLDRETMIERRHCFIDASTEGKIALDRGRETLLVNAAIMNERYEPTNGAWLVDVDLPKMETG